MFDLENLGLYDSTYMSKIPPLIVCPHCNRRYKWQAQLAGKNIKCRCNGAFLMPQSDGLPENSEDEIDQMYKVE